MVIFSFDQILFAHCLLRHAGRRVGGQMVEGDTSHIFLMLSLLASPLLSSFLLLSLSHSWQEQCVGVAQETSSRATSLECCLQSAVELILILSPSSPHNKPFVSPLPIYVGVKGCTGKKKINKVSPIIEPSHAENVPSSVTVALGFKLWFKL